MLNENHVKLSHFKQYKCKAMLAELATKSSELTRII